MMTMQYNSTTAIPSLSAHHRLRKEPQRRLQWRVPSTCPSPFIAYAGVESPLLPEIDDTEKKSPDLRRNRMVVGATRIFHHPNTVGVIGGVSDRSTADFMKKVVEWSSSDGAEENSLPLLLCSDPCLKKELSSLMAGIERQTSRKKAFCSTSPAVTALREKILFLESSGARCIVMPCHVSHAWYDELSQVCSVPFLHMGDCVADELVDANLKPIETGSNVKIGLLGTEATMTAGFYQEKLAKQGFEIVLPDKATMEHVVLPALEAMHRKDIEGARILLRIALQVLLVRAVSTIVLASYDMRSLLAPDDPLLKKCMDPVDALARATVKWSHSARNIT